MDLLNSFSLFVTAYAASSSTASTAATEESSPLSMIISFAPIILVVIVFYFALIRPQKKQEKKAEKMRKEIEVGDEIVTVGGIVGRVVSLRDENIVIETGGDRSKVRIMRWAVQQNNTVHDDTPAA